MHGFRALIIHTVLLKIIKETAAPCMQERTAVDW